MRKAVWTIGCFNREKTAFRKYGRKAPAGPSCLEITPKLEKENYGFTISN